MRLYTFLNEDSIPSYDKLIKKLSSPGWEFYVEKKDIELGFPELKGKNINTKKFYDFLVKKFNVEPSNMTLYRMLDVDNPEKYAVKIGAHLEKRPLGVHWSWLQHSGNAWAGKNGVMIIQATVPKSSVNWLETFIHLLRYPFEQEVFVVGPVVINKMYSPSNEVYWENTNKTGKWKTK